MIPKQAVEKAIEGGWFPSDDINPLWTDGGKTKKKTVEHLWEEMRLRGLFHKIALDPTFWQALGKALGWGGTDAVLQPENERLPWWKLHAMRFYDLILTGGDTEKFWEEILK